MNRNALWVYLVVVVKLFWSGECCVCVPRHPQTAFCRADYVIKALVISDRQETVMKTSKMFEQLGLPAPVFTHYKLHVTKVFKGKSKLQNVTSSASVEKFQISVHTSQAGAQCGMHLVKGKKYLISGRIFNQQLQINHCDLVKEFSKLSKQIKHGLHGKFHCTCQVGTCIDGYCDVPDGCKWEVEWNHPGDECIQNHRMCEHVDNKCQWSNESADFKVCKFNQFLERMP